MGKNNGGKCFICGAERLPLVSSKFKENDGTISNQKVCTNCWKNLWDTLLKGKGAKIA